MSNLLNASLDSLNEDRRRLDAALALAGDKANRMPDANKKRNPLDSYPADIGDTGFFWLIEAADNGACSLPEEGRPDYIESLRDFGGVVESRKTNLGQAGLARIDAFNAYLPIALATAVPGVTWTMSYGNPDGSHKEGATIDDLHKKAAAHSREHTDMVEETAQRFADGEAGFEGIYE